MDPDELKRRFGEEYPAAVFYQGKRWTLEDEGRFGRTYIEERTKNFYTVSRFMDGSAAISLAELEKEWPTWPDRLRGSFCMGLGWLSEHTDFEAMLRFVMDHGGSEERGAIANLVTSALPEDEAFDFLTAALGEQRGPGGANLIQGIAGTAHPRAPEILQQHLADLWQRPELWSDDSFMNWTAFDATCCILHLIEVGAAASGYDEQVRALAAHACEGNRRSTRLYLAKVYEWLS